MTEITQIETLVEQATNALAAKDLETANETLEQLVKIAEKSLRECDFDTAIAVGDGLKSIHHSACFPILYRACLGKGDVPSAVQTLQEGVETEPQNWTLWYWLGNHYADADRIGDAHEVFQKALECPDVERSIIHLSIAMAYCQEEKYAEGLKQVERIDDESLWLRGQALKIDSLINLERQDEAIALGKEILGSTEVDDDSRGHLARIQALVGCAIWGTKKDPETALEYAWKAIETDRSDPTGLWLIREVENRTSPSAKYMRLLIEGAWEVHPDPDAEKTACYTIYDVVADDQDEALEYIAPFEPGTALEKTNVKKCEILEEECAEMKGVYGAMQGYLYLSREGEGS